MARKETRLRNAFKNLDTSKQDQTKSISAILGFLINGVKTVEVANRPGYVYARIRSNLNEMIQVFNDKVSPVYDLPVLIIRDPDNPTRYIIESRDSGRYQNWGSVSSFLPRHGNQHSFNLDAGAGGDVTFVYDRQIVPLGVIPSGTSGSGFVQIGRDILYSSGTWVAVGGTGTPNLLLAKPTDNQARMLIVGLDNVYNPTIVTGSFFSASITGSYEIVPYLPSIAGTSMIYPLGAVRLVSGTSQIIWDSIYDLRQFGLLQV